MHFDSARGVEAKADSSVLGECGTDRWATLPLAGPFTCGSSTPHLLSSREKWHTHPQEHLHGDVYGTFIKITQTSNCLNAKCRCSHCVASVWEQLWLTESSSAPIRLWVTGVCTDVRTLTLLVLFNIFTFWCKMKILPFTVYKFSLNSKTKTKQNELQCRATIRMDLDNISLKSSRIFYTAWYPSYKVKYN